MYPKELNEEGENPFHLFGVLRLDAALVRLVCGKCTL
jgi:hypothetical protein